MLNVACKREHKKIKTVKYKNAEGWARRWRRGKAQPMDGGFRPQCGLKTSDDLGHRSSL